MICVFSGILGVSMVDNDPLTSVNLGKRIIVYHARHLEYQKKPISHNYSMDILYIYHMVQEVQPSLSRGVEIIMPLMNTYHSNYPPPPIPDALGILFC